jgi:hypothetical protein
VIVRARSEGLRNVIASKSTPSLSTDQSFCGPAVPATLPACLSLCSGVPAGISVGRGSVLIRILQWRDTWWFKLGDKDRQTPSVCRWSRANKDKVI